MPRSGSRWVASVLAAGDEVALVQEPDNPWTKPFALRAKLRVPGRLHPVLDPGADARDLEVLWRRAVGLQGATGSSGRGSLAESIAQRVWPRAHSPRPEPGADRLVLRSVHSCLCLEWVASTAGVTPIVVLRHPLNVISSWIELGWVDPVATGSETGDVLGQMDAETVARLGALMGAEPPAPAASRLRRAAFLFGLLHHGLTEAAAGHPDWPVVWHEDLCRAPRERLAGLADRLGLPWGEVNEQALEGSPASGPGVWGERLTASQVREIETVLREMGLIGLAVSRPG